MANIAQDVKDIIVDKLGVPAAEIIENASFQNDLGADSLDIVDSRRCHQVHRGQGKCKIVFTQIKNKD